MPRVVTQDEYCSFEVTGEVIAGPVSTRTDARERSRPRWFEATLYRKDDGSGYLLHTVNYSLVWHLDEDVPHVRWIRKALEIPAADLKPGALYCGDLVNQRGREQCPPVSRSFTPAQVIIELPQHKQVSTADAEHMIREMTVMQRGGGTVSAALSDPMRELLIEAEENEPAFRTARPVIAI